MENIKISHKRGLLALSPIMVFVLAYLVVSLVVGDFYKMPVSVAFIVGAFWAFIITTNEKLERRIEIFSKGAANSNILYMIWVFIIAGAFACIAKGIGAVDATVALCLEFVPERFLVTGIFLSACLISVAIGTSVGTVTAITPLAVSMATQSGGDCAYFVAAVLCGSFFGDNLSFISDTTIAATRTQGCRMKDKFIANLRIALPAALVVLIIYIIKGSGELSSQVVAPADINYWLILPYIAVIGLAVIGVNVLLVLIIGVIICMIIGICYGFEVISMNVMLGEGIDSMGDLIIVSLIASGMLALIAHNGGIQYLLNGMTRRIHGPRMAMATIGALVGLVNLSTANNTIAIITVGNLSKEIATKFKLRPRSVASILDTCSCIVQSIIPYGAQVLFVATLSNISPIQMYPYMYYPLVLMIMVILSIAFGNHCESKELNQK